MGYNLVDVTELIPVFIPVTYSSSQSFLIIIIITELICNVLNTLLNTYAGFESLMSGSNLGPPGLAIFKAFAVICDQKGRRNWYPLSL
jgi:hypothetical protein